MSIIMTQIPLDIGMDIPQIQIDNHQHMSDIKARIHDGPKVGLQQKYSYIRYWRTISRILLAAGIIEKGLWWDTLERSRSFNSGKSGLTLAVLQSSGTSLHIIITDRRTQVDSSGRQITAILDRKMECLWNGMYWCWCLSFLTTENKHFFHPFSGENYTKTNLGNYRLISIRCQWQWCRLCGSIVSCTLHKARKLWCGCDRLWWLS